MLLTKWDRLPKNFQCEEVKKYYDILSHKKFQLLVKRILDVIFSIIFIILLMLPMIVIAVMIKTTSEGEVIFKQERVTTDGRIFKILKFRTMYTNHMTNEYQITIKNDSRITPIGHKLRKFRLDELPQLFNVLKGDMSFVGTRPEVMKYVKEYTPEMYASLLMPAGITSYTCILYKDEEELFTDPAQIEQDYLNGVMAKKMKTNLEYIEKFSIGYDFYTVLLTVKAVFFSSKK